MHVGFINALNVGVAGYMVCRSLCTPMENGFKRLAQFSAGYFLYDIVMSLGGWGWAYILHAVFSFTAFAIPVFTPYAHRYACGFLCFEVCP